MKSLLTKTNLLIFSGLFLVGLAVFWPTIFQGRIPVPGDLLVSFYFPWQSGGWVGFDPWTTHKEFLSSDAIRQDIPWRFLGFELIKSGKLPLWNPYVFSGTPLLGNLQSAIFYPLNIVFLFLPFLPAWLIYVAYQPILGAFFTYLFGRELKLSRAAAFLASVAFIFSNHLIVWLELGIVGNTILWFPLILFFIEKIHYQFKFKYLLGLFFASACAVLAGHLQSTIHIFIFCGIYFLLRVQRRYWILSLLWVVAIFLLTAVQLLPSMELNSLSLLTQNFSRSTFAETTPWRNLISFFAPNFFGHPATLNYWSNMYGDGTPFFGIIPAFFAVYALVVVRDWRVKFFGLMAAGFLMFGFPGPIYLLVDSLKLWLLSNSQASRSLFTVILSGSILAGIGLDSFLLKPQNRKFFLIMVIFSVIYLLLWLITFIGPLYLQPKDLWLTRFVTSRRNLVFPTALFLLIPFTYFFGQKFRRLPIIMPLIAIVATIIFGVASASKTLSFSPVKFFYPQHPILTNLEHYSASDSARFMVYNSDFGTNFSIPYHLYSPEGYDSLRIKRYAELVAAARTGIIPDTYSRADALFPQTDDFKKKRLFDVLGVKYYLAKSEIVEQDEVLPIWLQGEFKITQRKTTLERARIFSKYVVVNDTEIISTFYDPNFSASNTLIVEKPLNLIIDQNATGRAEIINYQSDFITIKTQTNGNTLLFLSDAYYPGWKAYVDGRETEIYRADYAFRAILLTPGDHTVVFKYDPFSFKLGASISLISWGILISLLIFNFIKHKKSD